MTTQTEAQHYPNHDADALGQDYINHISAMTTEGLRAKSSIAIQLAWRDVEIRRLEADKDDWKDASFVFKERAVKAEARIKELEAANSELVEALKAFVAQIEWGAKISGTEGYLKECADKARAAIKKHGGAA